MSRNKYIKDYQLNRYVDEKGKLRTSTYYVGDRFVFSRDESMVKRDSKILLASCAVGWLGFVASLFPVTKLLHLAYFSLPFVLVALPLWLVSEVAVSLLTAKSPYEHKQSDKFTKGLKARSIFLLILASLLLVGWVVALVLDWGDLTPTDIIPSLSTLLIFVSSVVIFLKRNSFPTKTV